MNFLSNLENKIQPKILHDTGYLKLVDINGYHVAQEKDMLICIPYLVEKNSILLRYEEVPPYEFVNPGVDRYVVVMSESFQSGEMPEDVLKRGLREEYGIVLKDKVKPEILSPLFVSKGNTARYFICILPLMEHDYEQHRPDGDGSEFEMRAKNLIINIAELNNVIIYDMVTRYTVDLFKKYYSLF
jgi:hypothetical protein